MEPAVILDIEITVRELKNNNTSEAAERLVNVEGIHPDIVNAVADGLAD